MQRLEMVTTLKSELQLKNDICFAYLFGSQANEMSDAISDVDVAVYLHPVIDPVASFKRRLQILGDLTLELNSEDVDLIILDFSEENLKLFFNIINEGILLFEKNSVLRIKWESYVITRWFDKRFTYRLWEEGIKSDIKEGNFWP